MLEAIATFMKFIFFGIAVTVFVIWVFCRRDDPFDNDVKKDNEKPDKSQGPAK